MNPDLANRYHWFAYSWIGDLNRSLQVEPFVIQTRVLPIIAMIMAGTLAFTFVKDFTENNWVAATGALLMVIGPGFSIGSLVMLRSPSSAITVGWTLAFLLLFFRALQQGRVAKFTYIILSLLSIGVVAGKGVSLIVLGGGVIATFLNYARMGKISKQSIYIFLLCLSSMFATFVLLIFSPSGNPLKYGIYYGWPAIFLTILPPALGLFVGQNKKNSQFRVIHIYALSTFAVGATLTLFTYVSTGDQLYFILSSLPVSILAGLILMEKNFSQDKEIHQRLVMKLKCKSRNTQLLVLSLLLAGGFASFLWIYFENVSGISGDIGRSSSTTVAFIFGLLATLIIGRNNKFNRTPLFLIASTLILSTSITSSVIGILVSPITGPIYSANQGIAGYGKSSVEIPGAVSPEYFSAGKWVKENTKPDAFFFTNRQCIDPNSRFDDCLGTWFFASA
jgi:MFS family permease